MSIIQIYHPKAFSGNKYVKKIIIGKNIRNVGKEAFIEESGQFNKMKSKSFSSKQIYECRACKKQWILGKPDNTGSYLWEMRI